MTIRGIMRRGTCGVLILCASGFFLAGSLATAAAGQVAGRPSGASPPRPLTRKEMEEKGKGKHSNPAPATPGAPAPGLPDPAGGPAGGGAKRGEKRAAEELLAAMKRSSSALRSDTMTGELVILGEAGRRERLPIAVWRRFEAGGGRAVMVRHGRRADLPAAAALVLVDTAGARRCFRYGPEDRKVREVASGNETRIEASALRIEDLLPVLLDETTATFVESTVVEARPATVFDLPEGGGLGHGRARLYVRNDTRSPARMEFFGSGPEASRIFNFEDHRLFGVHRRWTGFYVREPGGAPSVVLTVAAWKFNDLPAGIDFKPENLTAIL